MKKEWADKWVEALRSGKYKQTKGHLMDNTGHCCLGVACEIVGRPPARYKPNSVSFSEGFCLPLVVMEEMGIKDRSGRFPLELGVEFGGKVKAHLSDLNDNGWSFEQIADFIEKHWEVL